LFLALCDLFNLGNFLGADSTHKLYVIKLRFHVNRNTLVSAVYSLTGDNIIKHHTPIAVHAQLTVPAALRTAVAVNPFSVTLVEEAAAVIEAVSPVIPTTTTGGVEKYPSGKVTAMLAAVPPVVTVTVATPAVITGATVLVGYGAIVFTRVTIEFRFLYAVLLSVFLILAISD
jgi:hypothetical protein